MKFFKPTVLGLFVFCILACNHANRKADKLSELKLISKEEKEKPDNFFANQQNSPPDTTVAGAVQQQKTQATAKDNHGTKVDWDKKIIKNASVDLEVKNYKSFNELVHENIKKYGGYIAQEEQNQTDYKIENAVTIKVPVDQFDDLVTELTKGGEKIVEKKITSEDVTTDIVDTKSRLEAKKQVRLRYLDLLRQAKNMEEILSVQNEINNIQEDIEGAAGRIEYLSHSATFSTISLKYFQVLDASAKNAGETSFGTKLWQSFKNGWGWVGDVFIGIIAIWPLFVIGFACWVGYKKWHSNKSSHV